MAEKWEFVTPKQAPYDGRPDEGTIGAKRAETPKKSPAKKAPPSKWSTTKRMLGLIPWAAILACSFLLTGLIIFLAHAKKAANRSNYVLELANSDPNGLYAHRVYVFSKSFGATAILAALCLFASAFLATARIRQKLAYERKKTWGKFKYGLLLTVGILSLILILLPSIWFTLNCMFLSAWGMGLYTLREAITAASITMQQADMSGIITNAAVPAQDGVCPAIGCFNLDYYVWLDSASECLCAQNLLAGLQEATRSAGVSVIWTLAGVGCMWFGGLIAAAHGTANLVLFKLTGPYKPPAKPAATPAKKPQSDIESAHTPGTAMKREFYPIHGYAGGGPGFYVRSPQVYA